jgi:succinoglycan biosynthesis protein ExoO
MSSAVKPYVTVSVVIPAYNAEKTIGDAIESVLGQSFGDLEVIVVNDGSVDDTRRVVEAFKDYRVILINHTCNKGEGAARNTGFSQCRGAWIAVLDADDMWSKERLERLLLPESNATGEYMIIDNVMRCFEADGLVPWKPVRRRFGRHQAPKLFDLQQYLQEPSYLIKPIIPRHVVRAYSLEHSDLTYGADAQFFIRLLKTTSMKIKHFDEALYFYRMSPGSMSAVGARSLKMKNMLLGLIAEFDFTAAERSALDRKLRVLDRQIAYEPFAAHIRGREFVGAIKYGMLHPFCLLLFVWRLPSSLLYSLAIRMKGGDGRALY